MAIQSLNKKGVLIKIFNLAWILIQVIQRSFNSSYVFYSYKTTNLHTAFNQAYIYPPIRGYSNFWSAKLLHWVNSPKLIDNRKFIIEINDHPFSVAENINNVDKRNLINFVEDMGKIYSDPRCIKIIFPCNKFIEIFQFYFSNLMLEDKFIVLPALGTIESKSIFRHTQQSIILKFLCIASDFSTKGVDLVINAWLYSISELKDASLTIVCHNIPQEYLDIVANISNISIIKTAPLDKKTKINIYKSHNVSIAPMHVHGGAVILEAVEFAHAIIYFETHTSTFINCGYEIKVPYYYYSVDYYGIKWNNLDDFKMVLDNDKKNGLFDKVYLDLSYIILSLVKNKYQLTEYVNKSSTWAKKMDLFENRNKKLLPIYKQILDAI